MHNTDEQREKDIIALCRQVLNISPTFWDNPNGPYTHTCPFCYSVLKGPDDANMSEMRHDQDCAYIIAKDLSTNLL